MDAGNEAVIAEILVEDSRGVFRGQLGQDDIYGFRVVPCICMPITIFNN
jgi:hypothetical protein